MDPISEPCADLSREHEIDLFAAWHLIWKNRLVAGAVTLASIAVSLIYVRFATPQYEAIATLEAHPFAPEARNREIFGQVISGGSVSVLSEEDIATTSAKLTRNEFLSKVAADEKLRKRIEPSLRAASDKKKNASQRLTLQSLIVEYLEDAITINHVRKTRLIDVAAKHSEPAIAALVADTFAKVVITDGISTRSAFAGKQIDDLEADYREVNSRMEEAQRRIALYTRSVELREALTATRNVVKSIAGRYKERHPKMIEAIEVVRKQEEALTLELANIRNSSIESAYWEEALGTQEPKDSITPAQVENLLAGRYLFLSSELEGMRSLHTNLSLRLNEIRIANNAPELDLHLFQSAVIPRPDQKIGPKKLLILLAGSAFGLCFGAVVGLLLALIRPRLENPNDWKAASAFPLLGMINEFPSSETTPFELVDGSRGYNPLLEQIRNLRIRLVCPHSRPSGSLLVTSALPQEGKTSIASALSLSMARATPGSVILVDLDLQQPSVHRDLSIANDLGVSDILLGKCSIEEALIEVDSLMVLTAGSSAFQALDRLSGPALTTLLCELKRRFSQVIIDSPPVLPTADTLLIGALCDEVLLVANTRTTPTHSLRQAEQELLAAGAKIRGGILNQMSAHNHKTSPQHKYLAKAYDLLSRRFAPQGSR